MTKDDDDNVNKDSEGDEDNTDDDSQNLSDNIFCTFPDETGLSYCVER